jgi:hypothetical protein
MGWYERDGLASRATDMAVSPGPKSDDREYKWQLALRVSTSEPKSIGGLLVAVDSESTKVSIDRMNRTLNRCPKICLLFRKGRQRASWSSWFVGDAYRPM